MNRFTLYSLPSVSVKLLSLDLQNQGLFQANVVKKLVI